MRVIVKLGAPLSQVVGEHKAILSLPEGATVADLLAELRGRYPNFEAGLQGQGLPRLYDKLIYSLFVNARSVPWEKIADTPLHDGDRVFFFLPVAGG